MYIYIYIYTYSYIHIYTCGALLVVGGVLEAREAAHAVGGDLFLSEYVISSIIISCVIIDIIIMIIIIVVCDNCVFSVIML